MELKDKFTQNISRAIQQNTVAASTEVDKKVSEK